MPCSIRLSSRTNLQTWRQKRSMMRSGADLEVVNSGASCRIVKLVRQDAVTDQQDVVLQRQAPGPSALPICGLLASSCGYQLPKQRGFNPEKGPIEDGR